MTKLKAKKPEAIKPKRIKMLAFGKAGVGKTWTALDFPNCYYIDSEGGATEQEYIDKLAKSGGMYLGQEDGSNDMSSVIEQIKALATERHEYKTLVIDSFSKLFNSQIAQSIDGMLAQKRDITNTFGGEKKLATSLAKTLVDWLDRIDMNVILICHEKPLYSENKKEMSIVGVTYDAWDKLDYELQLVVNITREGGSRKANIIKSRLAAFNYGGSIEWSYKTFADLYGRGDVEKETKVLELATPEQLQTLESLLGKWAAPENWAAKTLTAAKAEKFSEVDKDKMDKIIEYINNKLKGE